MAGRVSLAARPPLCSSLFFCERGGPGGPVRAARPAWPERRFTRVAERGGMRAQSTAGLARRREEEAGLQRWVGCVCPAPLSLPTGPARLFGRQRVENRCRPSQLAPPTQAGTGGQVGQDPGMKKRWESGWAAWGALLCKRLRERKRRVVGPATPTPRLLLSSHHHPRPLPLP